MPVEISRTTITFFSYFNYGNIANIIRTHVVTLTRQPCKENERSDMFTTSTISSKGKPIT